MTYVETSGNGRIKEVVNIFVHEPPFFILISENEDMNFNFLLVQMYKMK